MAFTCHRQPKAAKPDPGAAGPPTLLCEDKQTRERKREIDGDAWRSEEAGEGAEGLDWSGGEIKSQVDLQPLLLLLLLLAPSYQRAEGSNPPTPPSAALVSSTSSPLIVPSLMCPVWRNASRPALCHAPRGASRLAAPP